MDGQSVRDREREIDGWRDGEREIDGWKDACFLQANIFSDLVKERIKLEWLGWFTEERKYDYKRAAKK